MVGTVLITGGAGFIGCRVVEQLVESGRRVLVYDNLSRPGSERTAARLEELGDEVRVLPEDVRDRRSLRAALADADEVYHLADSGDPPGDAERAFGTRCVGTFNLLEEIRALPEPPPLVVASTAASSPLTPAVDGPDPFAAMAAERYTLGYVRRYGLPAVILRLSRVYGPGEPRQPDALSVWLDAMRLGLPVAVPDSGRHHRELLYVDDAARAFLLASPAARPAAGMAFDVAAGPAYAMTDLEVIGLIAEVLGSAPTVRFREGEPRGRARLPVSARRFQRITGWVPRVGPREGIQRLHEWLTEERPSAGHRAGRTEPHRDPGDVRSVPPVGRFGRG